MSAGGVLATARSSSNVTGATNPALGVYCITLANSINLATIAVVAMVDYSNASGHAMPQWRSSGFGCTPASNEITIRVWDASNAAETPLAGAFSFAIL